MVESHAARPAGKAMNVSRALAWMGHRSIAAGLWGADDYPQMQRVLREGSDLIDVRMTAVEGRTRQNVTVVDALHCREMHLRCRSDLASVRSLRKLKADLGRLVREGDVCVFAGAMPDGNLLAPAIDVVTHCRRRGARIVIDTHGPALRALTQEVGPWLISPNVEELGELFGAPARDTASALARSGGRLLDKIENVLISRGKNGAVLVTRQGVWSGRAVNPAKVVETVGCGDYLLSGFLAALDAKGHLAASLATGLKAATAQACGWTGWMHWPSARRKVKIEIETL